MKLTTFTNPFFLPMNCPNSRIEIVAESDAQKMKVVVQSAVETPQAKFSAGPVDLECFSAGVQTEARLDAALGVHVQSHL